MVVGVAHGKGERQEGEGRRRRGRTKRRRGTEWKVAGWFISVYQAHCSGDCVCTGDWKSRQTQAVERAKHTHTLNYPHH